MKKMDRKQKREIELLVQAFTSRMHEAGVSCSITIVSGTRIYFGGGPQPGAPEHERFLCNLVTNATAMVIRKLDATVGEPIPEERITGFIRHYSSPMPKS